MEIKTVFPLMEDEDFKKYVDYLQSIILDTSIPEKNKIGIKRIMDQINKTNSINAYHIIEIKKRSEEE